MARAGLGNPAAISLADLRQLEAALAVRCALAPHKRFTLHRGTKFASVRCPRMFLFFSNGLGVVGSIAVSIVLTLLLVYACSGP